MSRSKYRPIWSVKALALAAALSTAVAVGTDAPAPSVKSHNDNAEPEKKLLDQGSRAAELVENPDFEADHLAGWSLVSESSTDGKMGLDCAVPFDTNNPHSLRITVGNVGGRCGVKNTGTPKMRFEPGAWYDLTFCARTETNKHFGLVVSLESENGQKVCGRATIPEVGGDWSKYTLAIHAHQFTPKGRLVIALFEPGTIWLDFVSLSPRKKSD